MCSEQTAMKCYTNWFTRCGDVGSQTPVVKRSGLVSWVTR